MMLWAQRDVDEALAYQYYQEGAFEKAAVILQKIFDTRRDDQTFDSYFTALLRIRKYDEASALIRKLIAQYPQKPLYKIALGRVYLESGKAEQAHALFDEAITQLPSNEAIIRETANNFFQFEAYDKAIRTFLQGRKLLHNERAFSYELINIYRFQKDKSALINAYLDVLPGMPDMLAQAQNAFSSVFESKADYQLLHSALLKKLQKNPDSDVYNALFIWQLLQQQEYELALRQLIAQDKRLHDDGSLLYNTAETFVRNKAYSSAIKAYDYLLSKGKESTYYLPSQIQLVNARFELALMGKQDRQTIEALAAQFSAIVDEYGKTPQTLFALQRWAYLQAYYLNDRKKAIEGLEACLAIAGIAPFDAARLKMELGDTYLLTGQPWEAALLYEQVTKAFESQAIGQDAKFRSAKLAFYQGDFAYAKAQVDVLKTSTSQLMANDALDLSLVLSDHLQNQQDSLALAGFARAELARFSHQAPRALQLLDSLMQHNPQTSLTDDILMRKGQVYLELGEWQKAANTWASLLAGYASSIWADDALFMLAELCENQLQDTEKARAYYQQLFNTYPDSLFSAEARKRYRNLSAENLGI